ncbi:MAG TPA: helix-turn-helix domain-containing protein [Clostridiales bacterium]|nr:helix-turn-helix domain-containing protein [Clostridiales bacterium]
MRKSVEEKLKIIRSATSRKKIRKLAEKYNITTRTIKNWIKAAQEGKLVVDKKNDVPEKNVIKIKTKPLSELVLKIIEVHSTFKYRSIFRYLIKDMNYGFIICAYYPEKSNRCLNAVLNELLNEAEESKIKIRVVYTDTTCHKNDFSALKGRRIIHEQKTHKYLKKYLNFTLKKHSCLRDRTYYESKADFMNDSKITVNNHNQVLFKKYKMRRNKYRNIIQNFNEKLHFPGESNKKGNNGCEFYS